MLKLTTDVDIETGGDSCCGCRFAGDGGACLLFREYRVPFEDYFGLWVRLEACFDAEKKAKGGEL